MALHEVVHGGFVEMFDSTEVCIIFFVYFCVINAV